MQIHHPWNSGNSLQEPSAIPCSLTVGALLPEAGPSRTRSSHRRGAFLEAVLVQGYIANKRQPPPRTLQLDYTLGPMVVLGGLQFLMIEVPLYEYRYSLCFELGVSSLAKD